MFKKKEKINTQEVFDSLLFSFEKDIVTNSSVTFKLSTVSSGKSHLYFIITLKYPEAYKDKSIILFEPETHKATIPYFKQQLDSEGKVDSYILILKEFLDNARRLEIRPTDDNRHVNYVIEAETLDFKVILTFYESDMYPSVSKYIINTAAESIYKKTMKGK